MIAFLIVLFLAGLPLFYLELTLAQFSKFGPLEVWKVVPAFRGFILLDYFKRFIVWEKKLNTSLKKGIGICSLFIAGFISIYYNVIICWSLIYVISSFVPTLPWTECSFDWNDEKCCITKSNDTFRCPNDSESAAKQYFE